jgi:hypothetical protein
MSSMVMIHAGLLMNTFSDQEQPRDNKQDRRDLVRTQTSYRISRIETIKFYF